jgi:PAS domain S-box-containing protein
MTAQLSGLLVEKAYPFIDIAVLDGVRERLVLGDALCVLTPALDEVLWSNAAGARLLGFDHMDEALGADPAISSAAQRQIEAAGFGKTVAVRLAGGVSTRLAMVELQKIELPDGDPGLLISEKAASEKPSAWIEGLDGEGGHAAVIGSGGQVIAGSPGFAALGIDKIELAKFAGELRFEADRMVKRLVPSAKGMLPAGIGLVSDEPPLGLLVVVEPEENIPAPVVEITVQKPEATVQSEPQKSSGPIKTLRHYFAAEALDELDLILPEATSEPPEPDQGPVHFFEPELSPQEKQDAIATEEIEDEGSVFVAEAEVESATPVLIPLEGERDELAQSAFTPDLAELPVRFAWRINAKGEFSEVSPEFARVVGPNSADILGRTFRDVARVYGLDPGDEISDLLDRRDTWSGRSVLWPIEGTDLRAPVDLAALPVHDRDRKFDGFKGFGIVRMADAIVDAEGIGLSLAGPVAAQQREAVPEQHPDVEEVAGVEPDLEPMPRTEKPVLIIVPKPKPDFGDDKVIRLEARRQPKAEPAADTSSSRSTALNEAERSAFREIAERLRESEGQSQQPFGKRETPPAEAEGFADNAQELDASKAADETVAPDVADEALSGDADLGDTPVAKAGAIAEAVSEEERLKYEAMLRDLIETADTPVAPDLLEEVKAEAAAPLDYDAMLRDILETADKPAIDEKMIRVMPAEEILRVAEEHHQQELEAEAQIEDALDGDDLPLAAVDDTDLLPPEEIEEASSLDPDLEPRWPEMTSEAPALPPNLEIETPEKDAPVTKPKPDTSLLHRLPAPVLIYGGRHVHFANPAFLETTGYNSARELEILGGIDQLIAGDDPDEGSDRISIRIKGNGVQPFNAQIRSVPWDGNPAMMLTLGSQEELAANAKPVQVVEEPDDEIGTLRRHAAELTSILDTATDGVVVLDAQGRIRSLNQSAEALFGFDPAEVAGKPFSLLLATESQRPVNEYIAGMATGGVASIMNDGREVIGREAKGRFIPLFMTIGRLEGSDGYCAVLRDMTQWKRAEEELIAARRAAEEASNTKSEFLTRVSHEIRTPLNAIIGFSELMSEERFGPLGNQRYVDYAKDINRSGTHVLDLVNDLLDISKIEAGEQELNFAAVALNETLGEAVALMQPQANRERVIIRSSFASTLPDVVADLRSVKQIALNLLSNAVRYTGAGGQVIVSTAYELSGDVVVRVRDTGAGMSEADIEQAMKPFKQLNTVKRGRGDGTGLGLPLTKALVEGNRARFSIHSTVGKGTLVEITFPSMRVLAN